jgi:hypothetical protein
MGSSSKPQTVNTVPIYPEWMQKPMEGVMTEAERIAAGRNTQGYQGTSAADRLAPMNAMQQQAIQSAGNSAGMWHPFMGAATTGLAQANDLAGQAATRPMQNYDMNAAYAGPSAMVQAGQLGGANLQQYLNPWTDQVTRGALGNLNEQRQMTNLANADQAAKAKAFGGSRHGIVEAQTNAAFGKSAADLSLNSAQQNYQNAQQMAMGDINRNLQAQGMNQGAINQMNQFNAGNAQQANQFNAAQRQGADMGMRQFGLDAANTLGRNAGQWGELAGQAQQYGANDFNNMLTAGNMMQDHDQSIRDWNYQEGQNRYNFPLANLGIRQAAVAGSPYKPGGAETSNITRNRTAGFLGGAQQGYQNTGSGWGALFQGLLGAYG